MDIRMAAQAARVAVDAMAAAVDHLATIIITTSTKWPVRSGLQCLTTQ